MAVEDYGYADFGNQQSRVATLVAVGVHKRQLAAIAIIGCFAWLMRVHSRLNTAPPPAQAAPTRHSLPRPSQGRRST